jgi:hypothetical protein
MPTVAQIMATLAEVPPAVIAVIITGIFGIVVAITTARVTARNDRMKFERETQEKLKEERRKYALEMEKYERESKDRREDERRKYQLELENQKQEMKRQRDDWQRQFASQYAEAAATNKGLAEQLRQQFALAFLYVKKPDGHGATRHFIPRRTNLTIGSNESCDIVIPNINRSVSGTHAFLSMDGDSVILSGLRPSANAILVNDEPVAREIRLRNGDFIKFGDCDARFVALPSLDRDVGQNNRSPFD